MKKSFRFLGALLACLLAARVANAQAADDAVPAERARRDADSARTPNRVFDVQRSRSPIRIDAKLDEAAWREAVRIPVPIEITPRDNAAASVATDCRVTFDAQNVYLGCEAFDPDPSSIRAFITRRDGIFGNHDRISFLVDPFNDSRRGFVFEVSAVGVQADLSYDERTQFDETWDGIWSSAGRITEHGFIIEAAIPFRTLRFPSTDEVQTWRFWINRMRPRSELTVMRTNTRIRGESCQLCQAHLLRGFTGMRGGLNVELVPTLTGSASTSRASILPLSPIVREPASVEAGLDLRWNVTSSLSLNATANPDFSQVEADAPQLNANNAFALRFPERRPFFVEGADLFRTPLEVMFTRTVTRPVGGLKLTGKQGPHALGVLAAVDETNALLIPGPFGSSTSTIDERVASATLRYRRDLAQKHNVGLIYTGRTARSGYDNQVAGVDAFVQPTASLSLNAQALASSTHDDPVTSVGFGRDSGRFGGHALWTRAAYNGRAWYANTVAEVRSSGFRADAGFIPQTDFRGRSVNLGYQLRGQGGALTLLEPAVGAWRNDQTNGSLLSEGAWLNIYYQGPWQSAGWFNPVRERARFVDESHTLHQLYIGGEARPLPWLRVAVNGNLGEYVDFRNGGAGEGYRLSPQFDAQLGRHVEVGGRYSRQELAKNDVAVFVAQVSEARGVFNLNARTFVRGVLQYRRTDREPATNPGLERVRSEEVFAQFLFSYRVNPLTVAFLGLTDDRMGVEELTRGRTPLTPRGRTYFFKLGYAWRP